MRTKEEAHDYRYFPEPDLPTVVVTAERERSVREGMPRLPADLRRQLESLGLSKADAVALTTVRPGLASYFNRALKESAPAKLAANLVLGTISAKLNELGTDDVGAIEAKVPAAAFAGLARLIDSGTISHSIGKDVFEKMFATGRTAQDIVAAEGLGQIDDEAALVAVVADVLAANDDAVAQYRNGKTSTFGFLVGQVMKATAGKANPRRVNELLRKALSPEP
jgi:aspartyl-tRNA(Asn)/glutamyl-tRNA(Gln) amidotransferase subunit B